MDTLREGSRTMPVKLLQRLLNKKGAAPRLVEDGVFGRRTKDAVEAFQRAQHLTPDDGAGRR